MSAGEEGIVWRLDPSKLLAVDVEEAIAAHKKRTGVPAEVVDLHPDDFKRQFLAIPGVDVREDARTLKGEVFVGIRTSSRKDRKEELSLAKPQSTQRRPFVERAKS